MCRYHRRIRVCLVFHTDQALLEAAKGAILTAGSVLSGEVQVRRCLIVAEPELVGRRSRPPV